MVKKMAPRRVKICPGCPSKDLDFDVTPQFNFVPEKKRDTKKITIISDVKNHIKGKISSLF